MKKIIAVILSVLMILPVCNLAFASNDVTVKLNGQNVQSDVAPQIISDRTMIPLRAIFEALGATVAWNDTTKTVTAVKGNDVINCTIDSYVMYVNGVEKQLDVPPMIVDNRTLVPVRFVAEALGCSVGWDGDNKIVTITSKDNCYPGTDIISFTSVTNLTSKGVFKDEAGFIFNEYVITDLDSIVEYIDALTADGWTVARHDEGTSGMIETYKKGKRCVEIWLTVDGGNVDERIAISYHPEFFDE